MVAGICHHIWCQKAISGAVSNVHANVNLQNTQSSWAEGTLSLLGEQNGMGFISQGLGSDPEFALFS